MNQIIITFVFSLGEKEEIPIFATKKNSSFNYQFMRNLLVITLISILSLSSCLGQKTADDNMTISQRELLKDYFLCVCITEGFKDKNINEDDISQSVYFDILKYDPEALQNVKDYAKSYIKTIVPSPIEDLGNGKAIILNCIEQYKSKDFDDFIKQLDSYLLNDTID